MDDSDEFPYDEEEGYSSNRTSKRSFKKSKSRYPNRNRDEDNDDDDHSQERPPIYSSSSSSSAAASSTAFAYPRQTKEEEEEEKEKFDTWRLYADALKDDVQKEILEWCDPNSKTIESEKKNKKENQTPEQIQAEEDASMKDVSGTTKTEAMNWIMEHLRNLEIEKQEEEDASSFLNVDSNPYRKKFDSLLKGLREERSIELQKTAIIPKAETYVSLHAIEMEVAKRRQARMGSTEQNKTVGVASFWRLQKEQALAIQGSIGGGINGGIGQIPLGKLRFQKVCEWAFVEIPRRNVDQLGKPVELDLVQKMFINAFLSSCAPLIHGIDWRRCEKQYLIEHKLKEVNYHSIVVSPRRFGKTWSVAIFVLALLWCVPGITIAVFSTNQRTSEAICGYVRKFLYALPDGEARLGRKSKKEIAILPIDTVGKRLTLWERQNHPNSSVMMALPATGDGCQETATPVYQTLDGKYTCPDEDGPFKYARYEIGMLWYKQTRVLCCTEDCPTNCRLPEQLCHVKAIIPTEPSHYQRRERCDLFDLWS